MLKHVPISLIQHKQTIKHTASDSLNKVQYAIGLQSDDDSLGR